MFICLCVDINFKFLWVSSNHNFCIRNHQTGCTILLSHHYEGKFLLLSILAHISYFPLFQIVVILLGVWWYLNFGYFCIFLISDLRCGFFYMLVYCLCIFSERPLNKVLFIWLHWALVVVCGLSLVGGKLGLLCVLLCGLLLAVASCTVEHRI